MNTALWCVWYAAGDVTVPRLVAQELSALVVLAATLVVYRTFRERYLLVWILGWLAYLAANSTFTGRLVGLHPARDWWRLPKPHSFWPWVYLPPRYWSTVMPASC